MKNTIIVGALGLGVSAAMLAFGFYAGSARTSIAGSGPSMASMNRMEPISLDRGGVEEIVRDYLVNNPEILAEMQVALSQKQEEEQRLAQQGVIEEAGDEIFNASYDGMIGNPEGRVTIVEFFDYNCGFCKRALSDMETLVERDDDLRFVLKEFPILGPDSQKAHIVSMAFRKLAPEKYGEFHTALLGGSGRATEAAALKVALSLGMDEAALREEMKNPEINAAFASTYDLANRLAITGTPSYVVGGEIIFGAMGRDVLAEKVEMARACLDGSC